VAGVDAQPDRRAGDDRRRHHWPNENWYRDVWLLIVTIVVAWAVAASYKTSTDARDAAAANSRIIASIEREGRERRDETCRIFEAEQKSRVTQLRRTYDYVIRLTPRERASTLNKFVFLGLPQMERQAGRSVSPPYCDEPGVGLPGSPPKVPKRPPAVDRLRSRPGGALASRR
jgi:hypothetical protein